MLSETTPSPWVPRRYRWQGFISHSKINSLCYDSGSSHKLGKCAVLEVPQSMVSTEHGKTHEQLTEDRSMMKNWQSLKIH